MSTLKDRVLMYPPGAGGSWLISTLHNQSWNTAQPHFHEVWNHPNLLQHVHHRFDRLPEDKSQLFVLGGSSWFNFYVNLVYKLYHLQRGWLTSDRRDFLIIRMINVVAVIREHEQYQLDFEWEWLFHDPTHFYESITNFQLQHQHDVLSHDSWQKRSNHYISTCVNPLMIYEDWNNLYWVCAVLGQACYQGHWVNLDQFDYAELRDQAKNLYPNLLPIPCIDTKTLLTIPDLT